MNKRKRIRRVRGYTQDELAKRARVTQRAVSDWETGKRNPHKATEEKIAAALDVSVEELHGSDLGAPERLPWETRREATERDFEKLDALEGAWVGLAEIAKDYLQDPTKKRMSLVARTAEGISEYVVQDGSLKEAEFPEGRLETLNEAFEQTHESLKRANRELGFKAVK